MSDELTKLRRGEYTTITVPKPLKERISELKEDEESFAEFLYDLIREDVISEVDKLRRPGKSRGDVIREACCGNPRSPEELDALREVAVSRGAEVVGDGKSIVSLSTPEKEAIREELEDG